MALLYLSHLINKCFHYIYTNNKKNKIKIPDFIITDNEKTNYMRS